MAPKGVTHIVFGEDDESTPINKYEVPRPPTPPLKNGNSQFKRNHSALENGNSTNGNTTHTRPIIKRPKVINFGGSDNEEEESHSAISGPSFSRNGQVQNGSGANQKADEMKRIRAEATRLEIGRRNLPIWECQETILEAVKLNDTIVILGKTGSGKTTQVPQFLLKSIIPVPQPRICVTQPRRVAATSLASRVAAEAATHLGDLVGYTVRFDDKSSKKTRLKYMTDGALLAEMLGDRDMDNYDVIILDEAHERTLRTDMLMGFLKDIQVRRKEKVKAFLKASKSGIVDKGKEKERKANDRDPSELKIIVMSATLDSEKFSAFFNNAPVLYVEGRQYKVKIMYAAEPQDDYCEAALKCIFDVHLRRPPGDILVFLPGQEDIESLASSINSYLPDLQKTYPTRDKILVCQLYSKLSPAEQANAFKITPPKTRKVILSTNVAETSVTIPGIKYVIDTGMVKEKEYHSSIGIDTLVVENISRSSAQQRTGRAGRESDGICFRLYTEQSFLALPLATKPEIKRVSLTFTILHLLASGQTDPWSFQYMDKPDIPSIQHAMLTLLGLQALDNSGSITEIGKKMAALPLDPAYARVLLTSFDEGCPSDILDLVSLLSSKDSLLINSAANREAANLARKKFHHRTGDHMMLLNILRAYEEIPSPGEKKIWCRENFINSRSMLQVLDARKQLRERCDRLGLHWDVTCGDDDEPILCSLVAGLFSNIALRQDNGTYTHSISRQPVTIHPGSILHGKNAFAIIYDELTMTTRPYARGVSSIELAWIRTKAPTIFNAEVIDRQDKRNGV